MKEKGIKDIFMIIKKNIEIFLIVTGLFLIGSLFVITKFVKNKYMAQGSIMIQVESYDGSTNTTESQRLVQSTVDILTKMNLIPNETSNSLKEKGYNVTTEKISSSMFVSSSRDSLVITITYISEDIDLTKVVLDEIINSLIKVTNDEQYNMDKTLKNNISKLYVSDAKFHSPNRILLILLGTFLGSLIALIIIFTIELINSGYKEKDEIEEELNIQVLGVIPNFEVKRGNE